MLKILLIILLIIPTWLVLWTGVKLYLASDNAYYQGPKSDHFDGTRFFLPEELPPKEWWHVWKWRLTANRQPWPQWVEYASTDKPPSRVSGAELRVSFVNHTTFLLQTRDLNILTDPIWSERCSPVTWAGPKRVHAPGIAWNDLPKIDLVTISHSHYDHLDIPTLKNLVARDNPQIVVPLGLDIIIWKHIPDARIQVLDWNESFTFNAVTIHAEPSYHWSARTPWDRNHSLWAAFIYEFEDGNIYFSGDTGFGSGKIFERIAEKFGPFRFGMIDIGAYEPRWFMQSSHVNPDEAVQLHRMLKIRQSVAMHFGTFQLSDEAIDQPVKDLHAAMLANNVNENDFRVLEPGQFWTVKD